MVRCRDDTLYTGITTDPARRLAMHNAGTASRYTRSRRPIELVYLEQVASRSVALQREIAIKALRREEKLAMIERIVRRHGA